MTAKTSEERVEAVSLELIRLTAEFCDAHLNEAYKQLAEKLILTMKRRCPALFLSGRANTWAAAVIYALGQINFLFDRSFEPYVAAADIPPYFGVSQSMVGTKAKLIRDSLGLFPRHPEFSTQRLLDDNPYSGKVMMDGVTVPIGMLPPELQEDLRRRGIE